jgi:CRISPR-associated protein Cas2
VTVIVVERVTQSVRGVLSLWMLEVHAGVFVGKLSARVREKLWFVVCGKKRLGACTLIVQSHGEQGFSVLTSGEGSRELVDYDGLILMCRPARASLKGEVSRADVLRIAGDVGIDPRTVEACLSGKRTRLMVRDRVLASASALGIVIKPMAVLEDGPRRPSIGRVKLVEGTGK